MIHRIPCRFQRKTAEPMSLSAEADPSWHYAVVAGRFSASGDIGRRLRL